MVLTPKRECGDEILVSRIPYRKLTDSTLLAAVNIPRQWIIVCIEIKRYYVYNFTLSAIIYAALDTMFLAMN